MSIELSLATSGALPRRQNAALKPQRPAPAANDELVQHEFSPLRQGSPAGHEKDFSAGALAVVVAAHMLTIAVLLYQASLQPVEMPQAEPAAMMVSLVSNPAQEAEPEVLEVPPEPQPVKPVVERKLPVKQAAEPQPMQEQPSEPVAETWPVLETAPTQAVSESEPAETTSEPQAPAVASSAEKPAEAPVEIEPPRFGAAYLHNPPPRYPPISRRLGEQGRVMLRVLVSAEGTAESVEIERSSGFDRLDRAAVEAVRTWQFIPAKRDKQPISAHVIVPIQFTLNG